MRKALYILGVLDDSDIDWMVSIGKREHISAGTILIHEGSEIRSVYIVLDGAFAVRTAAAGSESIAVLKAGEIVGEMSFVDARPPSADVVALENSTVLSLPRSLLTERLKDPGFAMRFYRALAIFLANRLRKTVSRFGYGKISGRSGTDDEEEIGPTALENLSVAGARFEWMLKKLRGQ